MPDFPKVPVVYFPGGVLSTGSTAQSEAAYGLKAAGANVTASTAIGTANIALYCPVMVARPYKVYKMSVVNGTVVAGTTDVGIYNEDGTRLVSIGPTTQAGTSALQTFDITDTHLNPGVYFLALASSDATATFANFGTTNAVRARVYGCLQETSLTAGTLPASATFATYAQTFVPQIIAHSKATV